MQIDASTRIIYHNPAIQAARVMATYASASGGWWDNNGAISGCIGAWQAKGAASLAASYTDLSGNGANLSVVASAPSWATGTGWSFAATDPLDTGLLPGSGRTWIMRFGPRGGGTYMCGGGDTAGNGWLGIQPLSTHRWNYGATQRQSTASLTGDDVFAIAGVNYYLNGTLLNTNLNGSCATSYTIYIGALNLDGSVTAGITGPVMAAALYSTTLSGTDVGTITTAMAAL